MSSIEQILNCYKNKSDLINKYIAIIYYRNKIISIGYNYLNKCKFIDNEYCTYKYSIHAELNAISQIKNKNILNNCYIIIMKYNNNNYNNAIPCDKCKKLISKYKLNIKYLNIDKLNKFHIKTFCL